MSVCSYVSVHLLCSCFVVRGSELRALGMLACSIEQSQPAGLVDTHCLMLCLVPIK